MIILTLVVINKNTLCKGGGISACNIDGIIWSLVRDIILFREPEDFASVNNTHQSNLDELERMILNFNGSLEELEKKRIDFAELLKKYHELTF